MSSAVDFWTLCATNGIVLEKEQIDRLERFAGEILKWNDKVNLISRKDTENLAVRHILHSMCVDKYAKIPQKAKVLDVGTGGGFPGIPLKIARPDIDILLVDSIKKKIAVVEVLARNTHLRGIEAMCRRAESLVDEPSYVGSYDVVTSRAVAPLVQLVSWTKELLKPGGQIVVLKGGDLSDEIAEAQKKFDDMKVAEHQISIVGEPWFTKDKKKVLICTFG